MPKKIRELKAMLKKAGFSCDTKRGKGSHSMWFHPLLSRTVNIAGNDGNDAKAYQEKDVLQALADLEAINQEDEE